MTLIQKIKIIYAEIKDSDFPDIVCVRNDSNGEGDYIDFWNHPTLSRPTQEQLNSVKD